MDNGALGARGVRAAAHVMEASRQEGEHVLEEMTALEETLRPELAMRIPALLVRKSEQNPLFIFHL